MATRGRDRERLPRLTALVGLAAVVLVLVALGPMAIREQRPTGSAAHTAAQLTGEAQAATDGLRRFGFSCADVDGAGETLTRMCSRVLMIESAEVRMIVRAATGEILVSTSSVDEAPGSAEATRDRLREIIPDRNGSVAGSRTRPVKITGSIDALAAAAQERGYVRETPEVQNIRGCTREQGGYTYRLWMQGTDRFLATLDLEVLSVYRSQTRRQWLDEMTVVVSWLGTDQGRRLSSWLAENADAPGARSYVDGLPVYFLVRANDYTKETFGGVAPECGRSVNNISGCSP